MAISASDQENMRLHFGGLWRGEDAATVWDQAHKAFCRRFATTVTLAEFRQLARMYGNQLDDCGGGGNRPHAFRLEIGQ